MKNIFEIFDKNGKNIHLSKERWSHIKQKHPNVENQNIIEDTIIHPIKEISIEENIKIFYKYFKDRKESSKFLKVIVKYLNGNGYVITSYFVRDML